MRDAARQRLRQVLAFSVVCTAIMPQPMSTPTAAGMIAPLRRDHRTHGRALADVHVRHHGQVRVHERHARDVRELALRLLVHGTPRVHIFTWRRPRRS
jgi:hypothetical protein